MDMGLSWMAVIMATFLNMFFGSLWYSPVFFGKRWLEANHFKQSDLTATKLHYLSAIGVALLMSISLGYLMQVLHITDISTAVWFAFWGWLAFVVTSQLNAVIWAKRPAIIFAIDAGYLLVASIVTTFTFALWT